MLHLVVAEQDEAKLQRLCGYPDVVLLDTQLLGRRRIRKLFGPSLPTRFGPESLEEKRPQLAVMSGRVFVYVRTLLSQRF
jgi:hypothetical protein